MFEDKTFENILDNMLEYVRNRNAKLDTRDGSIIYTALAPMAMELETAYHNLDRILDESFVETASKEYLVRFGNQLGVLLNEATCGHFLGEFDAKVEIGSRFNLDEYNYSVIQKLKEETVDGVLHYFYELVCETAGKEPNELFGYLTPITYVDGLTYAALVSNIILGEDEEDTEAYRYRLQVHTQNPPIDGNIAQYVEWLDEFDGVGKYRIIPCWDGANTVKVVISDSENRSIDTTIVGNLVDRVQEYLDPESTGMGDGKAPIGAIVSVCSATETKVFVSCDLKFKNGTSDEGVNQVKDSIREYLKTISLESDTIDYMQLMAAIYNTDCVEYVQQLSVTVGSIVMNPSETPFVQNVTLDDTPIWVLDEKSVIGGV